jgi:hypothetical protein
VVVWDPGRCADGLDQTTFFTEEDARALFGMYDRTGRGFINGEQFKTGKFCFCALGTLHVAKRLLCRPVSRYAHVLFSLSHVQFGRHG